jgi:5'-3' exonuclease
MNVHLVDGTFELFRAYYGAPSSTDAAGREVGATRAWLRSLAALLREPGVTHIGVAFDHVIESFRNQLYPGYKTGAGIEPDLLAQFPLVERATRALGVVCWPMVEFEADDALAAAAAKFRDCPQVERVYLCTPDKDLAQCVRGDRVVSFDRIRKVVRDEAGVIDKFGVAPASIPDWLALVGDSADGIPGIARWGAKSAASVLAHYRHLDAIPDDDADWAVKVRGAAALARNLRDQRADATLFRTLAVLREDAPIDERLADLAWRGAHRDELSALCSEIGETDLLARTARWR